MKYLGIVAVLVLLLGGVIYTSNTSKPSPMKKTESSIPTSAVSPMEEKKKAFTLDEVMKHGLETDCWMAINGKVYNVTEFVSKHPGGPAILKGCGKDASVLFNTRPDTDKGPHPDQAKAQLEKLYIGELSS